MLQQTQVATVIPYFYAFIERFPDIETLASASTDEVLRLWSGLGYYRRARDLHRCARIIVNEHGGRFPDDYREAVQLPGLGRYTTGAILSIAFGRKYPVLDGNVIRVFCRLIAYDQNPRKGQGLKILWELAERLLPQKRVGDFNEALMELGATICLPKGPLCRQCPLRADCRAHREMKEEAYPIRPKKKKPRLCKLLCLVIQRENRILLVKDSREKWYRDMWRLPFVEVDGFSKADSHARREIEHQFELQVTSSCKMGKNRFVITMHRIEQQAVFCEIGRGRVRGKPGRQTRWISRKSLRNFPLPSGQKPVAGRFEDMGK